VATILIEEAADAALATHWPPGAEVLEEERHRQMQLTLRLIVNGSDPLVLAVYHRLCTDHTWPKTVNAKDASSWSDLAHWGHCEGLLDREEMRLVRRIPLTRPQRAGRGAA
jgi:hypothetical protein